jgi:hypothetical protein
VCSRVASRGPQEINGVNEGTLADYERFVARNPLPSRIPNSSGSSGCGQYHKEEYCIFKPMFEFRFGFRLIAIGRWSVTFWSRHCWLIFFILALALIVGAILTMLFADVAQSIASWLVNDVVVERHAGLA